jgi:hypothetical protein
MSPLIVRVLQDAGLVGADPVAGELEGLRGDLEAWAGPLRSAGGYLGMLAMGIAVATAVVVGVGLPALGELPGGVEGWPLRAGGLVAIGILVSGMAALARRWPVPGVDPAWRRLDGYAVLESTRLLVAAGVDLPLAFRASGAWARDDRDATALGRALEAGEPLPAGLLGTFEASSLRAAAGVGAASAALTALSSARRAALPRELSSAAFRIEVFGLVVAGAAVLSVGASWMWVSSLGVVG